MRVFRLAALTLCALACATGIAAAATGIVYVHVIDAKTNKPSRGWTVQLTALDGDAREITGPSGQATFLTVMAGLARIDVLQRGHLGACPAIIMVNANEQTIVNVHVRRTNKREIGCAPQRAQTLVRPGVTSDVYDIH